MGKKFDLGHLDEEESVKILNVLENDFQLRMQERARLGKLRKKVCEDDKLAIVLSNQKDFNDNCCIRCYKSFFLLFNPKFVCFACKFNVCKSCCTFFFQFRAFVCNTCQKEKDIMTQSCEWFYETVQRKFRQCGSVKVARRLNTHRKNPESAKSGRIRPSILDVFTEKKKDNDSGSETSSNDEIRPAGEFVVPEEPVACMVSDQSDPELYSSRQTSLQKRREVDDSEAERIRRNREFEEAFPEVKQQPRKANEKEATDFHVRASENDENSQKGVLRRMKAMQMARFHERVHDVMIQIRADIRERFPNHLPSPRRDPQFRQFVRKSREELTVVLKNFSQILAITIESHNLALGRSSEDVQMDIQYILQDEVETIVSRRIDVLPRRRRQTSFDDSTSLYTDEGSKLSQPGAVEQRLAGIILKKIFDDYRVGLSSSYGPEEAAAIRELDQLLEEAEGHEYYSSGSSRRRTQEVDPDFLSVSDTGAGRRRNTSDLEQASHSGSQYSGGSNSQWLLKGKPSTASAGSMSGLGKSTTPKVGGRTTDELSELSGDGEDYDLDVSQEHYNSDYDSTLWTGTSNEETKNQVLRQLRQQDSGINVHFDASPPSSAGIESSRRGRSRMQRRIEKLSRDMISSNKRAEGAAAAVDNTAEQMEGIYDQLSNLEHCVSELSAELTPADALRQSSDLGVSSATRALQHVRSKPYPFPVGNEFSQDLEKKKVEEDIYIKASEMADLIALIEDLEGALLKDSSHSQGKECPHHLQRWSSIEGHVVSTVDDIGSRVTEVTARGMRNRNMLEAGDSVPRRSRDSNGPGVRRSSSDVNFGSAAQRYDPWLRGQTNRDAWEEYRHFTKPSS